MRFLSLAKLLALITITATTVTAQSTSISAVPTVTEVPPISTSVTPVVDPPSPTQVPPGPLPPPPGGPRTRARLEPADGQIILGAWLDTENRVGANDRPSLFNQRIGRNAGSFQLAEEIPLRPNPFIPGDFLFSNISLLDEGTDASLFMTVYPYSGFDAITDADIDTLVEQVNNITRINGRSVFIRYGPEMNGDWMQGFGRRPAGYIASFRRVAQQIHDRTAAAMVWSPNLDQNGDSFTEYYPGDEYVDWVGLSVYWKGPRNAYPWIETAIAPENYAAQIIDGLGGEGSFFSFYREFAAGRGKPFAISEGAGCFHRMCSPPGSTSFVPCAAAATLAQSQMSFYNSLLFSQSFRTTYPLVKMVQMFEFEKEESDGGYRVMRDFRASIDPESLAQFRSGLDRFDAGFQWASPATLRTTTAARTTATATSTTAVTSTTVAVVTTTTTKSGDSKTHGLAVVGTLLAVMATVAALFA
ncbi:hypothetical protein BC829DRAFT_388245 [Chytridium lagenaria]|nr:hypothetical protein BC829DRAFT_388245 [Chytridium lagenaria]